MADYQPRAEASSLGLVLSDELPGARVLADRGRLLQVITNLLSNAMKYAPAGAGSRVEISVSAKGANAVCISVSDDGPGIPEESLDRLFQPFYRVEAAAQQEGTGLGLSIVKRLMDGMDGFVTAESRLGSGTTFHVILPAASSASPVE